MTTVVMGRNGNSTLLSVLLALGRAKREAGSWANCRKLSQRPKPEARIKHQAGVGVSHSNTLPLC